MPKFLPRMFCRAEPQVFARLNIKLHAAARNRVVHAKAVSAFEADSGATTFG